MKAFKSRTLIEKLTIPFISIVSGFILGALIMLFFGYNPIAAYDAMIMTVLSSPYFIGEVLRQATVLTLTGLAFNVAYQSGFFNIGLSGQLLAGWLSSVSFALAFPDVPKVIMVPSVLIIGTLSGALFASIAGVLRAYLGTNEVVVTIMLNYIILYSTNYLIREVIGTGNMTEKVGENASLALGFITTITGGSRLNMGILIAIVMVILYGFVMKHTTMGFELKAVGLNKEAAEYAGIHVEKNIVLAIFLSGGLAGLAGVIHGIGTFGNLYTLTSLPSEGFNGIAVGLLGMGTPLGTFLASILFGILNIGASFMPNRAGVPDELARGITAAIIFFIGSSYIISYSLEKFGKSKKQTIKGD
ncbi:ABC transporter permease [Aerococcus sp. HMSC10H05]|uniref:ABC transporter permease n=1 Tax=Aerococcus sp. HMSC10H05 TaxID=1581084 RepID=UPI0008A37775|nr:ABC transporter permease [Aerococcus sp. HMSC10H05]OFU49340.1 branched-chain amino acid ABC transporter permease [Aerococcus sp. HMSC10H05]